jgi:predicted O-methyltransferase YrrM
LARLSRAPQRSVLAALSSGAQRKRCQNQKSANFVTALDTGDAIHPGDRDPAKLGMRVDGSGQVESSLTIRESQGRNWARARGQFDDVRRFVPADEAATQILVNGDSRQVLAAFESRSSPRFRGNCLRPRHEAHDKSRDFCHLVERSDLAWRSVMTQEQWSQVDEYIVKSLLPSDAALDAALRASSEAGLPAINVAPNQGKFLSLLASIQGARSILEIGTLGGYSTIWLARALPSGGRLVSLELDPKHAEVARQNLTRAGVGELVSIRVGRALDTLPALAGEGAGPFDFVFIDADKQSIPEYFQWALKLTRAGSVIVVDNVVRRGAVIDASSTDANVQGVRRFNELLSKTSGVSATEIQTVGSKGYDGFALIRVLGS